jgi:hypothetical protein
MSALDVVQDDEGVLSYLPQVHREPRYPEPPLTGGVAIPEASPSFDHLVGAGYEVRRDVEPDCLGGLEIDRQLELDRLLHR